METKITEQDLKLFNKKKAMLSTNVQAWRTPKEFYDKLNQEFNFDFDPCPINEQFNGLEIEWGKSNYVNPPFKDKNEWIKKSYKEWMKGKTVVMLLPVRGTDTKLFHECVIGKAEIRFVKGRLVFDNANGDKGKYPAPFPTMLLIFKKTEVGIPYDSEAELIKDIYDSCKSQRDKELQELLRNIKNKCNCRCKLKCENCFIKEIISKIKELIDGKNNNL